MEKNKKIIDSRDLLMSSLSKFYHVKSNIQTVIPIINGESSISLRLIDWFVTNYSKKFNIVITKQINKNIVHFNVYLSYRSQLKAYSKQLFDPFRRRDRISFVYDGSNSIETTIGQLNFFRWVVQNDILEYINKNLSHIENDMIKTQKENNRKKTDDQNIKVKEVQTKEGAVVVQKRKKRIQLSKSSVKNMNIISGHRVILFD